MDVVNGAVTRLFDVLLLPLEKLGREVSLLVVSGVFGVLALWVFKHISWQKGIKATKDKIKAHLIEIRIYQDDLAVVSKAIGKVLGRNLQYLGLNFGPFVPLAIPFAFVVAQMVVRYGFDPVELQPQLAQVQERRIAGEGIEIEIEGDRDAIADLELVLPDGVHAVSKLARIPQQGRAFQEVAAVESGVYELVLRVGDREVRKSFVAGEVERPRTMQPERVTGAFSALLWPAERTLAGTGLTKVSFAYPESDLGWLPFSGPLGVILVFLIASMAVGFAFLKPLGVQI